MWMSVKIFICLLIIKYIENNKPKETFIEKEYILVNQIAVKGKNIYTYE